ncbi:helix-turn-helix domain-containing protein [Tenacibaculum sp. HL-MS23]|uniref:helix-turn-helix domain-containing protein n=1 Tax=Tenacibaculum sp. HL-MS23 TaxID=3077734 RepID=UPI0028FC130B|nr:helix-turn-helix domain-containing protein [Tenacibaculum sp. HL-MS23]WNW01548.1 helix-turn-helix domain-containing protein [Tenacibaculum sp. HL-MS23]
MAVIQFIQLTPQELQNAILTGVKEQLNELKNSFQPKEPTTYLTRTEVSKLLSVDISTVHNLSVKGILQKYQIGGRILYKRNEVEDAIVKLN